MRTFSKRERILCGIFAGIVLLPGALLMTYLVIAEASARTLSLITGLVGLWGAVFLVGKLAITGRTLRFFDQPAGDALGLPIDEDSTKQRSNEEL